MILNQIWSCLCQVMQQCFPFFSHKSLYQSPTVMHFWWVCSIKHQKWIRNGCLIKMGEEKCYVAILRSVWLRFSETNIITMIKTTWVSFIPESTLASIILTFGYKWKLTCNSTIMPKHNCWKRYYDRLIVKPLLTAILWTLLQPNWFSNCSRGMARSRWRHVIMLPGSRPVLHSFAAGKQSP